MYVCVNCVFVTQGSSDGYLCAFCYVQLEGQYRYRRTNFALTEATKRQLSPTPTTSTSETKRPKTLSTSATNCGSANKIRVPCKVVANKQCQIAEKIANAVKRSKYHIALRHFLSAGPAARRAFQQIVHSRVNAEMKTLVKHTKEDRAEGEGFPKLRSSKSIEDFSWPLVLRDLKCQLPTLTSALEGAMGEKMKADSSTRFIVIVKSIIKFEICCLL